MKLHIPRPVFNSYFFTVRRSFIVLHRPHCLLLNDRTHSLHWNAPPSLTFFHQRCDVVPEGFQHPGARSLLICFSWPWTPYFKATPAVRAGLFKSLGVQVLGNFQIRFVPHLSFILRSSTADLIRLGYRLQKTLFGMKMPLSFSVTLY